MPSFEGIKEAYVPSYVPSQKPYIYSHNSCMGALGAPHRAWVIVGVGGSGEFVGAFAGSLLSMVCVHMQKGVLHILKRVLCTLKRDLCILKKALYLFTKFVHG